MSTVRKKELRNSDSEESEGINLYAPRFLYIGQAFRYSPENDFHIFNQHIYFII